MALNPLYQQQAGRTLPLAFGYVYGTGEQVQSTTTPDGQYYSIYLLGEGEWDGPEMVTGVAAGGGHLKEVNTNLYGEKGLPFPLDVTMHFHPGRYSVKGSAGMGNRSSGGDQGYDTYLSNFPGVAPPQCYSGIAYYVDYGPGQQKYGTWKAPSPVGIWRSTKCRIFDAYGNVTSYAFTTNPTWHGIEAILRSKIKCQQPPLAGLTDAEKSCFNWEAMAEHAARNSYLLANGSPRFTGNYLFAAEQTLTDILETILRVSRSFTRTYGSQVAFIGDDQRASVFQFTANHLVPETLTIDKKDASNAPNIYVPRFRDLNVPAIVPVVSAACAVWDSTTNFAPVIGGTRITDIVIFTTDGNHPFALGDYVAYDGCSDPAMDVDYFVVSATDGSGNASNTVFCCQGVSGATLSGTGGYLGTQDSRFAQRAPINVQNRAHQRAVGQSAPGLAVLPRVHPVNYDMGNSNFDQANRVMKYEALRDLGVDGVVLNAPRKGKVSGRLESIDANFAALIGVQPGDVITLDDWVSPEFTGDYEVTEPVVITCPSVSSDSSTPDTMDSRIELSLQAYNPNAYPDLSDAPGQSYQTLVGRGLNMADRLPASTPYWTMQATPLYEGSGEVNIYDCSVWWAGNPAPTAYPAFSVSGIVSNTTYALYIVDAARDGSAATFGALAGTDYSGIPAGAAGVALVNFSF